jgi:hypothetical protein
MGATGSVSIGYMASVGASGTVAIGQNSSASTASATSIGVSSSAGHSGAIALGYHATTSAVNQFALPSSFDRTGAFTIGDGTGTGTLGTPGTPQAYMTVNIGGTVYGIPLYTIVTPT